MVKIQVALSWSALLDFFTVRPSILPILNDYENVVHPVRERIGEVDSVDLL